MNVFTSMIAAKIRAFDGADIVHNDNTIPKTVIAGVMGRRGRSTPVETFASL